MTDPHATRRTPEDIIDAPRHAGHRLALSRRLLLVDEPQAVVDLRLLPERGLAGRLGIARPWAPGESAQLSDGAGHTLADGHAQGGTLRWRLPPLTPDHIGDYHLHLHLKDAGDPTVFHHVLRVADHVAVALTFDDGPAPPDAGEPGPGPTAQVLTLLQQRGIIAAFFVLTGPDLFRPWYGRPRRHPKGESAAGLALMTTAARQGHLLGVHWGGDFGSQHVLHPGRMGLPPYDADGDGVVEGDHALMTDLLQCKRRIAAAVAAAGRPQETRFVRPPLWVAADRRGDAREVYGAMGLHLVTTDAKLYDGGYPGAGYSWLFMLRRGLAAALGRGVAEPVVTLHDSNPRTARDLPRILATIGEVMAAQGIPRQRWRFVDDPQRLATILARRRFCISATVRD